MVYESIGYWLARAGVAFAGLFMILATYIFDLTMPELHDYQPPPLSERLPRIGAKFGVGLLFLLPNRLTLRDWLFWPRLVVSGVVGLYFVGVGVVGIGAGLGGGRDPAIFPVSLGFMLVGVSVPGCLWWRYSRTRR